MTNRNLTPDQAFAMFIAQVVRDSMEDFHAAHLSDAQMKELNKIIRDGIYTALIGKNHEYFLAEMARRIPSYWETPETNFLLPDDLAAGGGTNEPIPSEE